MQLILILAEVVGFLCLAASCLKILETGPTIGPPFSQCQRLIILCLIFLALYSSIELLSTRTMMLPGVSLLIFIMGLFSVSRAFDHVVAKVFKPSWFQGIIHARPRI